MDDLKVLLVDDEEEFILTLAERLELRGIDALTAINGEQALLTIEKEKPPVVILDVKMPGIGGIEILQNIKGMYPEIQVILLTGHGSTKDGIKGMRLGAFDYLMKPVKIEDLMDKMREAHEAFKVAKE